MPFPATRPRLRSVDCRPVNHPIYAIFAMALFSDSANDGTIMAAGVLFTRPSFSSRASAGLETVRNPAFAFLAGLCFSYSACP